MQLNARTAAVAAVLLAAAGCASKTSWQGAVAEKAYDKDLEVRRLAEVINNDDYYQIYVENRIYVLSDPKDFRSLIKVGEVPKTVTKIGGGPNGERLVYGLTSNEAKTMESKVGFKGGAQEMYEGNRPGLAKGFFGVLGKDGSYVATDDWSVAQQFKSGSAPSSAQTGKAPDGKPVTYVAKGDLKELQARFDKLFAK